LPEEHFVAERSIMTLFEGANPTQILDALREKWREIPASRQERSFSADLLEWDDRRLLEYWHECRRQGSAVRSWYQELYQEKLRGKRVADVGPGIGLDGIHFARYGARVTFVDIVQENLALLRRLCGLMGVEAEFYCVEDPFQFQFKDCFDALVCVGSLINAPFEFMQKEVAALSKFLRVGGSVLMLGYPKERFVALGVKDFAEFAKRTDGERTPWVEWYDDAKTAALFGDDFRLNWSRNFGHGGIEFNWFDLTKLRQSCGGEETDIQAAPLVKDVPVKIVGVDELQTMLGFEAPICFDKSSRQRPLAEWDAERDDGPILRYIFRNFAPRRHLEFGTWYGDGVLRCLEECHATVWTINLPDGETMADGQWAYGTDRPASEAIPSGAARKEVELADHTSRTFYRTDAGSFIGIKYRERGLGHRVCQILCDSRQWDMSNYPAGFFDTALIDGGHQLDVVKSDTFKAISLVRPGGIILWHDFVLDERARSECSSPREVVEFIRQEQAALMKDLTELVWIRPSWLLMGIRK
jgi:SAM-dependent methyltransferase